MRFTPKRVFRAKRLFSTSLDELSSLTAISPVDGRYARLTKGLRDSFSEYGLIKHRVEVEVRWFQFMSNHLNNLDQVPRLSPESNKFLDDVVEKFNLEDAKRVKTIERTTNHDVKSVEYFLKEKVSDNKELSAVSEFFHFSCTSEDINNLAYGLMLSSAREKHILPEMNGVIETLREMAHQEASSAMLARTHGQPATPTTIGKEMANFVYRMSRQRDQFASVRSGKKEEEEKNRILLKLKTHNNKTGTDPRQIQRCSR